MADPRPDQAVSGVTPDGGEISVPIEQGNWLLLFITAGCRECGAVWESLHRDPAPPNLVVVTPSPSTESRRQVGRLAPEGSTVVMSSDAWFDFGVRQAPTWVQVSGGTVVGRRPADST